MFLFCIFLFRLYFVLCSKIKISVSHILLILIFFYFYFLEFNIFILLQICEMEPGIFRDCDALVRNLQGRLEILAVSLHMEGDTHVDHYDDHEHVPSRLPKESADPVLQLSERVQRQTISVGSSSTEGEVKQNKCSTCDAFVGDSKQYREHFKSEWHKHNLGRKTRQLPPLSAEECMTDMEMNDLKADLKDYSF